MLNRLTPAVKNLIIINVIIFVGFQLFMPRLSGIRDIYKNYFSLHKSDLLGFRQTIEADFVEVYGPIPLNSGELTEENAADIFKSSPNLSTEIADAYREGVISGPAKFQPIQLITWFFNHGGFFHILLNMFIFFLIGPAVEHILGTERFLKFYFFCGIFGGLLVAYLDPSTIPVLGASGAIYGVMVAFALFFPREKFYFYFLIPVEARWFVTGIGIFSLIMVIRDALGLGGGDNISHFGHLAGMVAAFIFFYLGKVIPFLGR